MQATRVAPRSQEWTQFNEKGPLSAFTSKRGLPVACDFHRWMSTRGTIRSKSPPTHLQERQLAGFAQNLRGGIQARQLLFLGCRRRFSLAFQFGRT